MKLFNSKLLEVENQIDWTSIINNLKTLDVPAWKVTSDIEAWKKQLSEMRHKDDVSNFGAQETSYSQFFQEWSDCNYDPNSIKLYNYFPNDHYDMTDVENIICKKLGIKHYRSWISRLDTGNWVPWHWDVDPNEYSTAGLVRYNIFIGGPKAGHIFMLGRNNDSLDFFTNMPQGSIIKWNRPDEWHCGANFGFETKWMYHLVGINEEV